MQEILSKRTMQSKTYYLGGNNYRLVATRGNVHYNDNGVLKDIDMNIENGKIKKCDYNVELLVGKVGYKGSDPTGKKMELELLNVPYKIPIIEGNVAAYYDIEPDVDFKIIFLPEKIKVFRILKTAQANVVADFRSYREAGIKGDLIHKGLDNNRRNTKITITETDDGEDQKIIHQVFDRKVMFTSKKKRKRSWSDDVEYPVTIDPTSTFDIGANADDGHAFGKKFTSLATWNVASSIFNAANYAAIGLARSVTGAYDFANGAWFRFPITGIAQSTTITSATFKPYGGMSTPFIADNVLVTLHDAANAANPTLAKQVLTATNPVGNVTVGDWDQSINPDNDKTDYVQKSINVTSLVQTLVNANGFTSGEHMMFFINGIFSSGAFYTSCPRFLAYQRDWGTAKSAELIIDFVSAPSGWTHTINSVTAANMAKVNTVTKANISKINNT